MSRELSDLYRSLAADADGRPGPPELVRRHADRRARVRAAGECAGRGGAGRRAWPSVGARVVLRRTGPAPAAAARRPARLPAADGSARRRPRPAPPRRPVVPRGSPRRGRPGRATGARRPAADLDPGRGLLRARGGQPTGLHDRVRAAVRAAELCGRAIPSDSAVVQRRARSLAYKLPETPKGYVPDGSYRHTITIYRAGRADDALRELRQAVRRLPGPEACPTTPGVTSAAAAAGRGGVRRRVGAVRDASPVPGRARATRGRRTRCGWSGRSGSATW